jgi:hypothetical protein
MDRPVYLLRLELRRGRRWRAEKEAGDVILRWFQMQHDWTPARVLTGEWKSPVDSLSDIEILGVFSGDVLRNFPDISDVVVSTSSTDREDTTWSSRHQSRKDLTERLAGRSLTWTAPNWNRTRQEVIQSLPVELLKLCVFCRMPEGPGFMPCGSCPTCLVTLPFLRDDSALAAGMLSAWGLKGSWLTQHHRWRRSG